MFELACLSHLISIGIFHVAFLIMKIALTMTRNKGRHISSNRVDREILGTISTFV